jgi:hypothetical protein
MFVFEGFKILFAHCIIALCHIFGYTQIVEQYLVTLIENSEIL